MTCASALVLFGCSSLRHMLFHSAAWDLGIFDQAVYLISQGKSPISSFLGFHILGDHAAIIFYPLALLYKIYPTVYWLLLVQAIALASGALFTNLIARQAGLTTDQATAIAVVYLLYPLVFNINLYDFHPDVIALPALLGAILAARLGKFGWFCFSIFLVLGCKAVLSLTVAAMGVWLLLFEKKRFCGAIALLSGIVWFVIATKAIIPFFGGEAASVTRHISRYSYLGNSFGEILQNLLFNPNLVLGKIFSLDTLEYLALLFAPVIWGIAPRHLLPLIAAIPTLILNILADASQQRNLVHQYSLPILPFLLVLLIQTLAAGQGWIQRPRKIILWSLVAFFALGKYGYFWTIYLDSLDTWQATRQAIAQVQTQGGVYTTAEIATHLTHRPLIEFTDVNSPPADLTKFEYILLNARHPGWLSNRDFAINLINQLKNTKNFQLSYQQDEVYLFVKNSLVEIKRVN
ncbi:hypothetical protein CEN50_05495 [Fischerella thermalis CCMEE 5268]|uniref:DUF2079 domain-containing protein n=1 Tax=Fischerella thermalis CCMEE 5268 TaxID=2019662 RepID=A0A2N6KJP1_9CYAN|nr:DUF2079 domain-containing protein [Fischerella thermalis]PLZ99872.1 hypothetical protein CEN50_05495 [Fischerella thermalis CCMEE 5268]